MDTRMVIFPYSPFFIFHDWLLGQLFYTLFTQTRKSFINNSWMIYTENRIHILCVYLSLWCLYSWRILFYSYLCSSPTTFHILRVKRSSSIITTLKVKNKNYTRHIEGKKDERLDSWHIGPFRDVATLKLMCSLKNWRYTLLCLDGYPFLYLQ